jgi:hypothetical protein
LFEQLAVLARACALETAGNSIAASRPMTLMTTSISTSVNAHTIARRFWLLHCKKDMSLLVWLRRYSLRVGFRNRFVRLVIVGRV